MSLTIGRIDFGAHDLPGQWDLKADGSVETSGTARAATVQAAVQLRDAILGLGANPDEFGVPVTWSVDPQQDGWYTIAPGDVECEPAVTSWSGEGFFPMKLRLQRIGAQPVWESRVTGALLENDLSMTAGIPFHSVPASVSAWSWQFPSQVLTYTRASETGDVLMRVAFNGGIVYSGLATWSIAPADHYDGSVRIDAGVDVAGLSFVIGREFRQGHTWSLDNGLVRVRQAGGDLVLGTYDGSAWTEHTWTISDTDASTYTVTDVASIVRNGPEYAALKVQIQRATDISTASLTLSLRRGSRMIHVHAEDEALFADIDTPTPDLADWTVQLATPVAGSAVTFAGSDTVGFVASSGSVRPMLVSSTELTQTGSDVGGKPTIAGPFLSRWDFGLGARISGSDPDTASDLAAQWFAAQGESPRLVQR